MLPNNEFMPYIFYRQLMSLTMTINVPIISSATGSYLNLPTIGPYIYAFAFLNTVILAEFLTCISAKAIQPVVIRVKSPAIPEQQLHIKIIRLFSTSLVVAHRFMYRINSYPLYYFSFVAIQGSYYCVLSHTTLTREIKMSLGI